MNVKQLREILANMPDDAPVLGPASDHSYCETSAEDTTVGRVRRGTIVHFCEWLGEKHALEGEKPVRALVIR